LLETSPELTATAGAFRTTRLLSTTHNGSSGQLRQDGCLSEKGSRRPRPTIGKLKPSLRKRRIEMRLRRMPPGYLIALLIGFFFRGGEDADVRRATA